MAFRIKPISLRLYKFFGSTPVQLHSAISSIFHPNAIVDTIHSMEFIFEKYFILLKYIEINEVFNLCQACQVLLPQMFF